jgi:AcrR family transcriptional regulator
MSETEGLPAWRLRRRAVILDSAAELFARTPYPEVQMDEVARRAGVGKATLYRYVASKEELFLEVLEAALVRLTDRLRTDARLPPEAALARMIETMVTSLAGHLPSLRALDEHYADLVQRGRRVLRRRIKEIRELIGATLAQGMEAGLFRPMDLEIVPQLIVGMVRGGVMGTVRAPPERIVTTMLDLLLGGGLLAARPSSEAGTAARHGSSIAGPFAQEATICDKSLTRQDNFCDKPSLSRPGQKAAGPGSLAVAMTPASDSRAR